MTPPSIEDAQVRLTERVMDAEGVVGTMIAECGGEPCIAVLVEAVTDELRESIPSQFEGFPVEIRATGEIRALE
jgi:hypothetical protein